MVKHATGTFSKIRIRGKKVSFYLKERLVTLWANKARLFPGEKRKLSKKTFTYLVATVLCLIGLLSCVLVYQKTADILVSQATAERWAGQSGNRYTQISCFLNNDTTPEPYDLLTFADKVEDTLLAASLDTDQGNLWTYAYYGASSLTISGTYGTATASVWGVGGNYFLFHPLVLRDGSYISDQDVMDDRVVLDEELAWKLFGSVDIAGLTVTINNVPYLIAGVISREKDQFSQRAYTGNADFFMSYTALAKIKEAPITCYEIVLPDPISGFGLAVVQDNFPLGDHGVVIENTARFTFDRIIGIIGNFAERTIQDNGVVYPYWENAARLAENQLALLLILGLTLFLFPTGCLFYMIIKEIQHVKHFFKKPPQDI